MADSEGGGGGGRPPIGSHFCQKAAVFPCKRHIFFVEKNEDGADKFSKFLDLPLLSVQQLPLAFCTEVIRDGPGLIGPSRYLGSTQCHQNAIHITCRLPRVLVKVLGQLSSRKLLVSGSPNSRATLIGSANARTVIATHYFLTAKRCRSRQLTTRPHLALSLIHI